MYPGVAGGGATGSHMEITSFLPKQKYKEDLL
jgi:hypothetical protein